LLLPSTVNALLRTKVLARMAAVFESSVAAPPTVTVPVPSAASLPTTRPPALSATPPLKVLTPLSVCTPAAFLTRPPLPPITPLKVLSTVPPRVSVLPPSATVLPATPASEPMAWLPAEMSSVPVPARFTAPVAARLPPAPIASVPLLMVVPPV